jgi:hypothetical protein
MREYVGLVGYYSLIIISDNSLDSFLETYECSGFFCHFERREKSGLVKVALHFCGYGTAHRLGGQNFSCYMMHSEV